MLRCRVQIPVRGCVLLLSSASSETSPWTPSVSISTTRTVLSQPNLDADRSIVNGFCCAKRAKARKGRDSLSAVSLNMVAVVEHATAARELMELTQNVDAVGGSRK